MLLVALDAALLWLSATACGVPLMTMLEEAPIAMGALFLSVGVCYFGLLAGVAGRTCGASLFNVRILDPQPQTIDLSIAARRTGRYLLREASIVVNVLTDSDGYYV